MEAGQELCMRLDAGCAAKQAGPYHFSDEIHGRIDGHALLMGDFVIARKLRRLHAVALHRHFQQRGRSALGGLVDRIEGTVATNSSAANEHSQTHFFINCGCRPFALSIGLGQTIMQRIS